MSKSTPTSPIRSTDAPASNAFSFDDFEDDVDGGWQEMPVVREDLDASGFDEEDRCADATYCEVILPELTPAPARNTAMCHLRMPSRGMPRMQLGISSTLIMKVQNGVVSLRPTFRKANTLGKQGCARDLALS